jgi:hypothetical protein
MNSPSSRRATPRSGAFARMSAREINSRSPPGADACSPAACGTMGEHLRPRLGVRRGEGVHECEGGPETALAAEEGASAGALPQLRREVRALFADSATEVEHRQLVQSGIAASARGQAGGSPAATRRPADDLVPTEFLDSGCGQSARLAGAFDPGGRPGVLEAQARRHPARW